MKYFLRMNCPAKVNLVLQVLGRRPDGYHELSMLTVPVDLYDELQISLAESPETAIQVECAGVDCRMEDNLAYRAAEVFFKTAKKTMRCDINIKKRIPAQAGLGGGSSDCAGVLLLLNEAFGGIMDDEQLNAIADSLGADVRWFLRPQPSVVEGKGEFIKKISDFSEMCILILIPEKRLSTADVFNEFDKINNNEKMKLTKDRPDNKITYSKRDFTFAEVKDSLKNELEPAAEQLGAPIRLMKEALFKAGAAGAVMTGSGSAVVGIYNDYNHAFSSMQRLEPAELFVCRVIRSATKG